MGFTENYLERRKRRTGQGAVQTAAASTVQPAAGNDFTARYLARRGVRQRAETIPGLSLPTPLASRRVEAAETVPGLSLPTLPETGGFDFRGVPLVQSPDGGRSQSLERTIGRAAGGGMDGTGTIYDHGFQGSRTAGKSGPAAKDWAELAKDSAVAGIGQVSKAASSTLSAAEQLVSRPLGWLLGNPELYKDAPLYQMDRNVDLTMAAVQEDLAGSAARTGKAGELIAQYAPPTIAALPQAALAYLTAGKSLAAQTSTAGLQAASTAAQLTGGAATANTVLQSVRSMAANPSFQYSFLNTVGGEYQQALEDGVDAPAAYAYAALSSLANSVVEVGGGIDTLPGTVQGKSKGQLLEWVRSMFDEGKEEVVQGAISQLMQNGVYGKGNPLFSITDEDAVVNPGRMGQDFLGGAVVGGVLGGGQMAVNAMLSGKGRGTGARSFQEEVAAQLSGQETGAEARGAPGGVTILSESQTGLETRENGVREETGGRNFSDEVMQQLTGGFSTDSRNIAWADRRMLDNLGKITGSDIRVVSQEELDRTTGRAGADGVQIGNRLYISEAAERPVLEVARHELTHRLQDIAPAEYGAFRDYVAGLYRMRNLESYIETTRNSRALAGMELTEAEALDEIAADFAGQLLVDEKTVRRLAGENRGLLERLLDGLREIIGKIRRAFGGQADGQTAELERAARLWEDALRSAGESSLSQPSADSSPVGGAKGSELPKPRFSIGYDRNNRPFVTVEEDILKGVPREDWVRTVKDNLRKKFPDGVTVGNSEIRINDQSRREMTFSKYMQRLFNTNPEIHADKLRTTDNVDEILRATTGWINEAPLHQRTDDIADFARGEVQLRIGRNEYTADVVVGNRGENGLLLYDIINLAPTTIRDRTKKSGTVYTTNTQNELRSRGPVPDEHSIPRSSTDVKPPRTFSDEVMAQLTGEDARRTDTPAIAGSFSEEVMRQLTGERRDVSDSDTSREAPHSGAYSAKPSEGRSTGNTRFSMKGDADIQREFERLRRQNQRLREQMKRTDRAEMNQEAVDRQAREILKEYGSRYDRTALGDRLAKLYGGIANQTLSESDMRSEARSIAEDILTENREQTNGLYEEYQGLRKELRTRGISIAPEYRADLESAGGYEGLRKQYFGRLRLSRDGTAVDQVYDDLSSRYPELFPDSILHPADQLLRLAGVLDDLRPVMGNVYEGGMDQAAEYLAGELLERFYDTPEKVPTFADRQARKLAEQRAADRRQMLEAVAKERDKKETALRDLREKYREADRKRMENQSASQRRESIRRHADRLGRMLLRPTDRRHVPKDLRGAALELVRQIDTGSNYFLDPDTGKRVYARDGNQIDMENPGQVQTRRTAAARELQAQYEKLAAEGGYTVDPDMGSYLDELVNMGSKPLGDMSKAELDTVWKVMRVIEHCISKSDELLGRSRYATVSEMAERLREDADELPGRRQWVQPLGMIDGGLNLDMLTPETWFHKLGEAGDDLFRQMRRAQDKQITIQKDVLDKFQKAYEESGQKAWRLEKELHSFDVSGGEVTLTTAQIMELYALSKREQAIGHLYTGGIRPEAVRGKGLKLEGGGRAVSITPEDAAQITGALTKEQRALADRMQDILSRDLSAYGNEASIEVYGYEKFKEKNYWPIKIGSEDTRSDPAARASSRTIPGYGMTKTVQPDAKNPVVLHSAFDTFARHVAEMSTYAGWLGTNENAVRLLNYQFQDADGNRDGTIKDRLKHIHGAGGDTYMEKLLGDIAQGTKAGKDTIFSSGGMTSAFKSSAIAANMRVALQQPTAILRAMEMIGPKYFVTGLRQKDLMRGWETAKEYSPIAQWKDWGYFEIDTGRSYKEMMLEPKNLLDRTKGALMYPAGAADALGWGYLWKIVEAETADRHRDLKKGSEDFYRKTAERFGEIVDRTQVVDSVLHRTQMMRSEKDVHKMASSFMSEPSKQYNEVIRGLYDFTRAQGKKDGEGMKKAVGHLVRTAAAMSLSFAVNALAQSLPDMWRDHDRDRSNSEKFWDSWQENFRSNYNPLGYVPYLKDFWSVIDSTLLKKRAFGGEVSRMDMEVVTDIAKAAKQAVDVYNGEGKKSRANAYFDAVAQLCRAAGLPLATMKKDAIGIAGWWMQATGNNEGLYQMDKLLYEEGNDAQRFTAHLHRAMNADWEQYESIYQDMSKNWEQYGSEEDWTEEKFREKIQGSMEKRMAEEAGLEKVSSLPVEYSVPGGDLTFDQEVMRQLTGGKTWKDSLPEGTLELARDIDQLKPEKDAGSVTNMQKIREVRDSIWGSDVKDMTLKNILGEKDYDRLQKARKAGVSIEKWCRLYEDIADEKIRRTGKSGSPSQADVISALEGSGLSERQKDAIWSGYWNSERPGAGTSDSGARLTGLSLPRLS